MGSLGLGSGDVPRGRPVRPSARRALRRINVDEDGNEWLDESRVAQAEAALLRSPALKLIEANQEVTSLLLTGTTVDGIEGMDGGRGQTVHFIDWDHPEQNEFLAINQFRDR